MSSTRHCQDCGAEIAIDAAFCEGCGKRLSSTSPTPPPIAAPPVAPAPLPMPLVASPPTPVAPSPWYLSSSTWLALAVLALVVIGTATVIRWHSPQPASKSSTGDQASIASELTDAAAPGNDPAAGKGERTGGMKPGAIADSTPGGTSAPEGIEVYLGRWKIIAGETELPEDERYLEFMTEGEQVVAEVPALSARFEFAYDSSNGSLIGTFSDAKKTLSSSAEFDAANNCLHLCIGLERTKPMLMTAVPAN